MIKLACKILLKKEVLDSKGRAILKILQNENSSVTNCRYGKYIEIEIDTNEPQQALKQADELAKNILHNDLIEDYTIEQI